MHKGHQLSTAMTRPLVSLRALVMCIAQWNAEFYIQINSFACICPSTTWPHLAVSGPTMMLFHLISHYRKRPPTVIGCRFDLASAQQIEVQEYGERGCEKFEVYVNEV